MMNDASRRGMKSPTPILKMDIVKQVECYGCQDTGKMLWFIDEGLR